MPPILAYSSTVLNVTGNTTQCKIAVRTMKYIEQKLLLVKRIAS